MAEYTKATRKGIDLKEANAGVFYRAFRSMDAESRHRLALQILKDEDLLEDLYEIRREKHIKQRDKLIRLLSFEGWTQSRIANEVGMTQASVSRIVHYKQAIVTEGVVPRKKTESDLPRP